MWEALSPGGRGRGARLQPKRGRWTAGQSAAVPAPPALPAGPGPRAGRPGPRLWQAGAGSPGSPGALIIPALPGKVNTEFA